MRRMVGVAFALLATARVSTHDLERTQVSIAFARDGSFVLDVANDPNWLNLRLESFPGPFADRVVLWVDGHEIRPASVELIPFDSPLTLSPSTRARPQLVEGRRLLRTGRLGERLAQGRAMEGLAIHRMRGQMPIDAHTLRWYYGLVADPYPLTIRRADGRMLVEEIGGDAWSRTIDLSGQFQAPRIIDKLAPIAVVALLLVPVALRLAGRADGTQRTPRTRRKNPFWSYPLCP